MKKNCYVTAGKTSCIFKKHKTEDKKWRGDASEQEGQLCVVNQLKGDDMIKLQLNFPGKANVGERRRTALEHVVQ